MARNFTPSSVGGWGNLDNFECRMPRSDRRFAHNNRIVGPFTLADDKEDVRSKDPDNRESLTAIECINGVGQSTPSFLKLSGLMIQSGVHDVSIGIISHDDHGLWSLSKFKHLHHVALFDDQRQNRIGYSRIAITSSGSKAYGLIAKMRDRDGG